MLKLCLLYKVSSRHTVISIVWTIQYSLISQRLPQYNFDLILFKGFINTRWYQLISSLSFSWLRAVVCLALGCKHCLNVQKRDGLEQKWWQTYHFQKKVYLKYVFICINDIELLIQIVILSHSYYTPNSVLHLNFAEFQEWAILYLTIFLFIDVLVYCNTDIY